MWPDIAQLFRPWPCLSNRSYSVFRTDNGNIANSGKEYRGTRQHTNRIPVDLITKSKDLLVYSFLVRLSTATGATCSHPHTGHTAETISRYLLTGSLRLHCYQAHLFLIFRLTQQIHSVPLVIEVKTQVDECKSG